MSGPKTTMTYEEQHAALKADLMGKIARADWHGVSDAANDLRVLEAVHEAEDRVRAELQRGWRGGR